jgi:hypothetical protein
VNARLLKVQVILEPPAAHQRVGCARPRGPWPVGRRGSRNVEKLAPLAAEIGAEGFAVDALDPAAVALFSRRRILTRPYELDNRLIGSCSSTRACFF